MLSEGLEPVRFTRSPEKHRKPWQTGNVSAYSHGYPLEGVAMTPSILILTVGILLPAQTPASKYADRPPSTFAPSLPQLTDEEEEQIDGVIERFIQQDIGKLKGDA